MAIRTCVAFGPALVVLSANNSWPRTALWGLNVNERLVKPSGRQSADRALPKVPNGGGSGTDRRTFQTKLETKMVGSIAFCGAHKNRKVRKQRMGSAVIIYATTCSRKSWSCVPSDCSIRPHSRVSLHRHSSEIHKRAMNTASVKWEATERQPPSTGCDSTRQAVRIGN